MSKTRETWVFQEVVASSKLNQQITDYITRGQLIMESQETYDGTANAPPTTWTFAWFPYSGTKQLFDRMLIYRRFLQVLGNAYQMYYTIDTGASWVATNALAVNGPFSMGTILAPNSNVNIQITVDVSGVAAGQWIGFKWERAAGGVATGLFTYTAFAFLYNSVETPF